MTPEAMESVYPRTWARCLDRAREIAAQGGGTMDPLGGRVEDGKLTVMFLTGLAAAPRIAIARSIMEAAT